MMEEDATMLQRINNTLGRISIAGSESSWDFGFLESLRAQVEANSTLSPKQQEILQQVEGRFSDEALKARGAWLKDWDEDKEEKFHIALAYYMRTGYYSNITHKYLTSTGDRIGGNPSQKEYQKLVLNKYAAGVIRNIQSTPTFPVGANAVFRSNPAATVNRGKACIILKHGNASNIATHAKGAKPVQVLPIGSAKPVWTEERWLKKGKKRK